MINLIQRRKYEDGSAEYSFEYDKKFEEFYKQETGAQVVRKANVGKFIVRMLKEVLEPTPNKRD